MMLARRRGTFFAYFIRERVVGKKITSKSITHGMGNASHATATGGDEPAHGCTDLDNQPATNFINPVRAAALCRKSVAKADPTCPASFCATFVAPFAPGCNERCLACLQKQCTLYVERRLSGSCYKNRAIDR